MNNKILKYSEYLKENVGFETPESNIFSVLTIIKNKIEKVFNQKTDDETIDSPNTIDKSNRKKEGDLTLVELGIKLESIEISKYSKQLDNLKIIFIDDKFRYDLIISIELKYVADLMKQEDFDIDQIEDCICKFKKYDISQNVSLVGTITKKINVNDINEDELISLKIEIDEKFGDTDKEEFEIEYE